MTPNLDPPSAQGPAALGSKPPPRPWIILVVDDEPDVLSSFKQLLEQSMPGVKVITTTSGRNGIDILERERVDLVMSDFKMPGMDGIEFLVQARRIRPGLPRIMFTAFADEELSRRAISEAVVNDFLSKNVDPGQMVLKVEALLHYDPKTPGS
ncbi:MAG TPA: response regulator [Candidatus Thermoplasmatota archaeon]|nr:response regulator [Candidatus Thermoplasmatota archaeon]